MQRLKTGESHAEVENWGKSCRGLKLGKSCRGSKLGKQAEVGNENKSYRG